MDMLTETKPISRREQKEITRVRVLKAAREEFSERGYRCATTRSIGKRANRTTAAIFTSFNGKADLFASVFEEDFPMSMERTLRAAYSTGNNIFDILMNFFAADFEWRMCSMRLFRDAIALSWTGEIPRVANEVERIRQYMKNVCIEEMMKAIEAEQLPRSIEITTVASTIWDMYLGLCHSANIEDVLVFRNSFRRRLKILLSP